MIIPLWSEDNKTPTSSVFFVEPGNVVALLAVGLGPDKLRQDNMTPRDKQRICVSRMLRDFTEIVRTVKIPGSTLCDCSYIAECSELVAREVAETIVSTHGVTWQLTDCSNYRIVGVPGTYRLHLNDESAVGTVQVYAELFSACDIPPQVSGLFF